MEKLTQAHAPAKARRFPPWVEVSSWALYDLANTIFSAIVVTRYFTPYMVNRGAPYLWIAAANVISMFAAGALSPHAGVLLDRIGRGRTLLSISTLACVLSTALLGLDAPTSVLLAAFACSNFFYNVALVFYNAFMPFLAPPEKLGRLSGLGVGVGYLGLIPSLAIAHWLQKALGTPAVFPLAGALFLLFSGPALAALPAIARSPPRAESGVGHLLASLRTLWRDRQARLFFLGNFLCTDVLNALIFWIFVFVEEAFQFTEDAKTDFQIYMVVSNILASLIVGWLCDRLTARKAYLFSSTCLLGALIAAGTAPTRAALVWTTVPLAGFALGGVWTAGRKLLFQLAPPGRLGEYSGFYGLTGKVSSFTTLLYAGTVEWGARSPMAHRAAVLALAPVVLAGLVLIALLREPRGNAPASPQSPP